MTKFLLCLIRSDLSNVITDTKKTNWLWKRFMLLFCDDYWALLPFKLHFLQIALSSISLNIIFHRKFPLNILIKWVFCIFILFTSLKSSKTKSDFCIYNEWCLIPKLILCVEYGAMQNKFWNLCIQIISNNNENKQKPWTAEHWLFLVGDT